MRLLVTRPEPDAQALAGELRTLGHDPVLQPLLEFHRVAFDVDRLRDAQAIVITSGNSLRALQETPGFERIAGAPFYCVGDETARRAQAIGLRTLLATAENAEQLAARIVSSARKDSPLVHLTGEHQAFDLAGALAREGLLFETIPVYSMEASREFAPQVERMLKAHEIDGVILMSPRTAAIYVSLCHRHAIADCAKTPLYLCLSDNVAAKLASLKPQRVRISDKPNRKALLELLQTG